MSQFKPGDLALITKDNNPENVGRCVELLRMIPNGEEYVAPCGGHTINASGEAVWLVSADGLKTKTENRDWYQSGWTQKAPRNLMPLRGDFQPEQQKSREVVE